MSGAHYRLQTVHGYAMDEVVSSLQKCIRRSMVDEAIWWAIEMNESGFGAYAWRRLMVIVSEDTGLADHHAPVLVNALYQMSVELYKNAKGRTERDQKENVRWNEESLTHAVWYLAKAEKSRELCDHRRTGPRVRALRHSPSPPPKAMLIGRATGPVSMARPSSASTRGADQDEVALVHRG